MKKLMMTAAVVACAGIVSAQVYSQNIVGYNKADLTDSSGIQIVSVQFDTGNNTVSGVFGNTLPVGSKVYKFVNGSYSGNISEYGPVFLAGNAWSPDLPLEQGTSFWVQTTAATNIIAGEVEMAAAVTNDVVPGLQLLSFPYPVARTIDQLGFTPSVGDKIYKYSNGSYSGNISEYGPVFLAGNAWSPSLSFGVGEGFWYQSTAGSTVQWIAVKPF